MFTNTRDILDTSRFPTTRDSLADQSGIMGFRFQRIGFQFNPIRPSGFEGGRAWGRGVGEGDGKCLRPITLKLLKIMK